jgi:hypothetical protein
MTRSALFARSCENHPHDSREHGTITNMHRRVDLSSSIRLATLVSFVAVLAALVADTLGGVPRPAVIMAVIVVGFAVSLAQTAAQVGARVPTRPVGRHRVSTVPVRSRV